MSEQSLEQAVLAAAPVALTLRRILFLTLVGLTMAAMIGLLAVALSAGGFGLADFILVVLFAVTLPWMVIGFWNATIGFLIMRLARDPVATVTPTAARITGREPITASTAVLICIRNEPPERPAAFLMPLLQGLAASEAASHFHLYILSDTDNPSIAQAEERLFAAMTETGASGCASPIGGAKSIWDSRPATSATSATVGARTTSSRLCSMPTVS